MGVGEREGPQGGFTKEQEETFGGGGHVHYFDHGKSFIGAIRLQNEFNCTL